MSNKKFSETSDSELFPVAAREMDLLQAQQVMVRIDVTPAMAFAITGMIQLSLRHPVAGTGSVAQLAKEFLELVKLQFVESPAISEVLRRGDEEAEEDEELLAVVVN